MNRHPIRTLCAGALLLATGGCALFASLDGEPQQIEVHALLQGQEVAGVGCTLANDHGRWSVLAPGRVTVLRSQAPLYVDCLRRGEGGQLEQGEAPAERARLSAHLVIPAGGYLRDGRPISAYVYPATINADMTSIVAARPAAAVVGNVF